MQLAGASLHLLGRASQVWPCTSAVATRHSNPRGVTRNAVHCPARATKLSNRATIEYWRCMCFYLCGHFRGNLEGGGVEEGNETKNQTTNVKRGTKDLRACWQLTATFARPSDASIATAASLFTGVISGCAPRLQISRTPPDPRWIRMRRAHDHASTCSSAA